MAGEPRNYAPILPLGQKGILFGDNWEVKGFLKRCDSTGDYIWDEYLLSNPVKGYRWLLEDQGHWTFYEMVKDGPEAEPGDKFDWKGHTYKLYLEDSAKVIYQQGEFYWKVKVGEISQVADYVCAPYILSKEEYPDEIIWSWGQYVEPKVVKEAFLPQDPDAPRGSFISKLFGSK